MAEPERRLGYRTLLTAAAVVIVIMTTNMGAREGMGRAIGFEQKSKFEDRSSKAIEKAFSPEFRTLGANEETFEQIAARAAGELMSVGESHLVTDEARSVVTVRLWPYLLLAAVLLAPLDILCRRLG